MTPSNRRVSDSIPPPSTATDEAPVPLPVESGTPAGWFSVLRTTVGIALVLASSVGVAWAARRHVMTSARFAIADVDVTGNDRLTPEAIIAESGLTLGANVFVADLDAARARLLADPWIAEVSLARRLPGTIFLRVTERKPAALVAMGDLWLATAEGEPFKR